MLFPTSGADRNEGAFAIRACGTQAVIWIFLARIVFQLSAGFSIAVSG
jgi:hypothetical protein